MTVYIRHIKTGTIHSVSDEHYYAKDSHGRDIDGTVSVMDGAERYPKPGIEVISETQARKSYPQLFGKADPAITFTPQELVAQATYQKQLAEFRATEQANFDATQEV